MDRKSFDYRGCVKTDRLPGEDLDALAKRHQAAVDAAVKERSRKGPRPRGQ